MEFCSKNREGFVLREEEERRRRKYCPVTNNLNSRHVVPLGMLAQVKAWTSQNPNRDMKVNSIEIQTQSDTGGSEVLAGPGGLTSTPLEPPGPISLYLWYTDPVYRAGTAPLRRQFSARLFSKLVPVSTRNVRVIAFPALRFMNNYETQQDVACITNQDTHDLDNALCFLLNLQRFVIDEANKKSDFLSRGLMTWNLSNPIGRVAWVQIRCITFPVNDSWIHTYLSVKRVRCRRL
jgi:hypothetical protein